MDDIANTVSRPVPELTLETLEQALAEAMMVPIELIAPTKFGLTSAHEAELRAAHQSAIPIGSLCHSYRCGGPVGAWHFNEQPTRKHVDSREVEVKLLT